LAVPSFDELFEILNRRIAKRDNVREAVLHGQRVSIIPDCFTSGNVSETLKIHKRYVSSRSIRIIVLETCFLFGIQMVAESILRSTVYIVLNILF